MTDPIEQLDKRIARLDELIAERDDAVRGLGLRLALGLARELRLGLAPGTESSDLVAGWVQDFGPTAVDGAVLQAGALLKDPVRMAAEIGRRLEGTPGDDDLSGVEDAKDGGRA